MQKSTAKENNKIFNVQSLSKENWYFLISRGDIKVVKKQKFFQFLNFGMKNIRACAGPDL